MPSIDEHCLPREYCISAASPNSAKPLRSHCFRTTAPNWDENAIAWPEHESPKTPHPKKADFGPMIPFESLQKSTMILKQNGPNHLDTWSH